MAYIIDIDTGGTFTDGFIANGRDVRTVKVATTPHDLTVCFLECIRAAAKAYSVKVEDLLYQTEIIRFSNTIGTNTIIQRNGAKIGLLLSEGLAATAPTGQEAGKSALVEADMVKEISEQLDDNGVVQQAPNPQQVLHAAQELIDSGARVLVVALKNSEKNSANEKAVREIIKREYPKDYLGSVSVFLSSDISSRSGQQERINTAVLNAYIHPKLARLLYKAGEELRQMDYTNTLFIGHNNGSVARVAKTRAINTYNSGPAAGLLGAKEIGKLYGLDNLISTDMGGTSFDIGYVKSGSAGYALEPDVEGFNCNLPMMSIVALGTGGGSIAHIEQGELKVGPQSAGALPGPACFNLGGNQATVTDANLVLGVLDPDFFLGGTMALELEKARQAIGKHVAEPLGISTEAAALKIKQCVDNAMGHAIANVAKTMACDSVPAVVAYGGAGGLHACDIAQSAGVKKVIMTPFSAVSSAYSSSLLDPGHLYYNSVNLALSDNKLAENLDSKISTLRTEAQRDMRGEGFAEDELSEELQLFVSNGDNEILINTTVDFYQNPKILAQIQQQAAAELNGNTKSETLELKTIGFMVRASAPHYLLEKQALVQSDGSEAIKRQTNMYSAEQANYQLTPVYAREKLQRGTQISGPALVESVNTTLLIAEGWKMLLDQYDNAIFEEA